MANFSDQPNPYDSPQYSSAGPSYEPIAPGRNASSLPVFCLVMFILDLAFSLLRVPIVALTLIALTAGDTTPLVVQTGLFEAITGIAMVAFGLTANVALLFKQRWGLMLGWAKVAAALSSVAVGWWQMAIVMGEFAEGSPERIGGFIGGGIAAVFRLGLLALYGGALVTFAKWSARRSTED